MHKVEPYNDDLCSDPPARFATDAEIEIADRLLRQIEERYLAPSASSPATQRASTCGD